jgi:hypothetical protein
MTAEESAAERKRKRLEAWRMRQQQQGTGVTLIDTNPQPPPPSLDVTTAASAVKVSLSWNTTAASINKKKRKVPPKRTPTVKGPFSSNPFGAVDDDDDEEDDSDDEGRGKRSKLTLGLGFSLEDEPAQTEVDMSSSANDNSNNQIVEEDRPIKRRRKGRWDNAPTVTGNSVSTTLPTIPAPFIVNTADDALDKFMEKLEAGALGTVATQVRSSESQILSIDVGGSMMRITKLPQSEPSPISGGVITSEQIARLTYGATSARTNSKSTAVSNGKEVDPDAIYTHSDWESDAPNTVTGGTASEVETDDEEAEEYARRALIEALKSAPSLDGSGEGGESDDVTEAVKKPTLAAEVKSEKNRREQMLRDLEKEAEEARLLAERSSAPELGRLYNDIEGGVMEEAERNLDAAMAAPDALQVLAELNKKKELKNVDHSEVDYIPFKKNLYIVPRALANLSADQVADLRGKLKVKVRGQGAPAPVSSFEQCGLSERIMKVMEKQGITKPFPVQAQCLPCIMAGRDVIGIAKTGSGKTLAYLLPLLRHILDQPPLGPNESGPIGLILAPARELAYQIHLVCKTFTKALGLK